MLMMVVNIYWLCLSAYALNLKKEGKEYLKLGVSPGMP